MSQVLGPEEAQLQRGLHGHGDRREGESGWGLGWRGWVGGRGFGDGAAPKQHRLWEVASLRNDRDLQKMAAKSGAQKGAG